MSAADGHDKDAGLSLDVEFRGFLKSFQAEAGLTKKDLQDFESTTVDDVKAVILAMQKKQLSEKKQMYMRRLEVFLANMENYGKVIEVFLNSSDFLAFVWGPMKFMLLVACNFSEALNSLMDAYLQIGELLPQLQAYQQHCISNAYMRTVLALMYKDILEFHAVALKYFRKPNWQKLFVAVWSGFLIKLRELKEKMERHKHLIESQASIAQFEEAQKFREIVEASFKDLQKEINGQRLPIVQSWLSAYNSNIEQVGRAKERRNCPSSGQWLVDDDRFKNWSDPIYCLTPLLCLNGIPGAGKTTLTSKVVEVIRTLCSSSPMRLAFFYCKADDPNRNTFVAVARGLLSQLIVGDPELLSQLHEKRNLTSGEAILSDTEMAQNLLQIALESQRTTYIIIDGIDECDREERKIICSWFCDQVHKLPKQDCGNLRCLFVSREDGPAKKDLRTVPAIKVRPIDIANDVKQYILFWKTEIEAKHGNLDDQERPLVTTILASTQGMFLFAKLAVQFLYNSPTRQDAIDNLQKGRFPEEIGDLYKAILHQVFDGSHHNAPKQKSIGRLLSLLVCAKRPLRWYEIQGLFAFDEDDVENPIDHERRKLRDGPMDLCLSLVERHADDSVQLVHPTAKEYLIRSNHVQLNNAEFEVTKHIFAFLCVPACLNDLDIAARQTYVRQGCYSFYDYAVACWSLHLQSAIGTPQSQGAIDLLAEYLDTFLELHWSNVAEKLTVSSTISEKLNAFQKLDCFARLAQSFVSARKQLSVHGKGPSPDEPLDLSRTTAAIRETIEAVRVRDNAVELEAFYGPNWYKCPRVNCIKFYEGFSTLSERKRHVDRHERPYTCGAPDCPMAIVGYSTEKALQKHMVDLHGADPGTSLEFPAPPKDPARKTAEAVFNCHQCSKKFTRAFNLRGHLRTHAQSKPFACKTCGKKFARRTDCKRHEDIHLDNRSYICSGSLKNGTSWGCKRTFTRLDKFREHLQTQGGRRCIAPLIAEQEEASKNLVAVALGPKEVTNSSIEDPAMGPGGMGREDEEMDDAQWEELFESLVHVDEDGADGGFDG